MALYQSDFVPLIMRTVEALDRGETIAFNELRQRISTGSFIDLMQHAGNFPWPSIPDHELQELTDALLNVLEVNRGDEAEHFYVSNNGYCLLIAALWEAMRSSDGIQRPLPRR
jgi:hypothetical protein